MGEHTTFLHPHGVYRLRHPSDWETLQQDNARSCGFGPENRDDLGLWVMILPFRLDTSELIDALPRMFSDSLGHGSAVNVRNDPSLKAHGYKADVALEGQSGHHWIVADGDIVLLATSTVPDKDAAEWNPRFDAVMRSLEVTREEEVAHHRLCTDLLRLLRERFPDHDYRVDVDGIRGPAHVIRIHNLHKKIEADPERRDEILREFATNIGSIEGPPSDERPWKEVAPLILPALKPVSYFRDEGPTSWLVRSEWLPEVQVAYAIRQPGKVQFIHRKDLQRWSVSREAVHERALKNLGRVAWPKKLPGRKDGAGRVIAVRAGDGFEASRILHPQFHTLLRKPLGSPFLAAIPDRDTLLGFTDSADMKRELAKQVADDHRASAYPITDRIFRVTPDGVAPAID